ncbi:ER degradation-enhancing alpha-mannosidase 2 [Pelomyxa schiedti]|nr:ER degradation-enhancing alpha-mannosidase 2 [Pelomyxa schiedti]
MRQRAIIFLLICTLHPHVTWERPPLGSRGSYDPHATDSGKWYSCAQPPVPGGVFLMSDEEVLALREKVRSMFVHAYTSYMTYAYPKDELKSVSCGGLTSWGNCSLTLIDSLDSLVVLGFPQEFTRAASSLLETLEFDRDMNVSVFETNIRVLGGLLSTYLLGSKFDLLTKEQLDKLLHVAHDLGQRLLPAFDTVTGIPYGTVNLRHGVPPNETPITCTACGSSFTLEFGLLTLLTGDTRFEKVARRAVHALWSYRSMLGLLGNHIDTTNGKWTAHDASVGSATDSFYEYLLKASMLFNDAEYQTMFEESYKSAQRHLRIGLWYINVNMNSGQLTSTIFDSLMAFWPGMQALHGDFSDAVGTAAAFYYVWLRYGMIPDYWDIPSQRPSPLRPAYPLRPELAESLYYISRVQPNNMQWRSMARTMVESLDHYTHKPCGFCGIDDVRSRKLLDRMDSFFLAETLKYLYLIFDDTNWIHKGWVFSTEGHPFSFDLPPSTTSPHKGDKVWHPPKSTTMLHALLESESSPTDNQSNPNNSNKPKLSQCIDPWCQSHATVPMSLWEVPVALSCTPEGICFNPLLRTHSLNPE